MGIKTKNISPYSPLRATSFIQHALAPPHDTGWIADTQSQSTFVVGTPLTLDGGVNFLASTNTTAAFHWPICLVFTRSADTGAVDWSIDGVDQFGKDVTETLLTATGNAVLHYQTLNAFSFVRSITPLDSRTPGTVTWEVGTSHDDFDAMSPPVGTGGGGRSSNIGMGMPLRDLTGVPADDNKKMFYVVKSTDQDMLYIDTTYHTFNVDGLDLSTVWSPATFVFPPEQNQ